MEIVIAETAAQVEDARRLFEEYWNSFGFTPCFQGFGEEVASLPGAYASPQGRLLIAYEDGVAVGCAAFRPFDEGRCELKRLYVKPVMRGRGLGKTLMVRLLNEARLCGYRVALGDTMPVMTDALAMYDRMGFERIDSYSGKPTEGAICLRYSL